MPYLVSESEFWVRISPPLCFIQAQQQAGNLVKNNSLAHGSTLYCCPLCKKHISFAEEWWLTEHPESFYEMRTQHFDNSRPLTVKGSRHKIDYHNTRASKQKAIDTNTVTTTTTTNSRFLHFVSLPLLSRSIDKNGQAIKDLSLARCDSLGSGIAHRIDMHHIDHLGRRSPSQDYPPFGGPVGGRCRRSLVVDFSFHVVLHWSW
jgi:hypothetical protein